MKKNKPLLRILRIIAYCLMASMCIVIAAGVPVSIPRNKEDAPIEVVAEKEKDQANKPGTIDFRDLNG